MNNYQWKLADLIGDHEEDPILKGASNNLPISAKKSTEWKLQENPVRLTRMYKFSDETKFNMFIVELLELQSETQHHARITLQYPQIKVEVWTHTLGSVTEVDKEWSRKADDIYGDFQ